ncbi:hypothetical protein Hypma_002379 [Hypsizygus marmoreus]|uniref:Uncharacterized protein n=1 Tax=Hypsizygus marmoreus TaxID=39966 RepID=A0A369JD84_HYPMA|nr:hypothetical protein Hypma_002379 [Hypsizygus marmoreus]
MLKLKKLHSKVFKKSSASPAPTRRDPNLRHSRSMPLRSTNETDDSYVRPRPVYRGEHPLQPSDINHVLDVSPDADWPRYDHDDDDDIEDAESTHPPRPPLIDKNIVDAFPSPPTTLPNVLPPGAAEPARPPRPPATHLEAVDDDYFIPDLDPRVKAKMATLSVIKRQEEHRAGTAPEASGTRRPQISSPRALQPRQQQLRRSSSSTSRYWRPTTGYSKLAAAVERDRARGLLPRNFDFDSVPRPSTSTGMYSNATASQSTRSLADPRYRAALADHQRRHAAGEASSISTSHPDARRAIYGNPDASQSTRTLNCKTRYHPANAGPSTPAIPIHQESSASLDDHATMHRQEASSASSRSALSAKRLAIAGRTPAADAIEQQHGQQPRGAPRIARGMHGGKLHCPVPVRPVRFDLRVNELNGKEWVVGGNSKGGQPATVAGQGRGGVAAGRR